MSENLTHKYPGDFDFVLILTDCPISMDWSINEWRLEADLTIRDRHLLGPGSTKALSLYCEYLQTRHFEHFARSLLTSDENSSGGLISSNASSGWHVITPFQLSDRSETILVNRGWVSKNNLNQVSREDLSNHDEIDVIGVVRTTEPRQQFQPKNSFRDNKWLSRWQ